MMYCYTLRVYIYVNHCKYNTNQLNDIIVGKKSALLIFLLKSSACIIEIAWLVRGIMPPFLRFPLSRNPRCLHLLLVYWASKSTE